MERFSKDKNRQHMPSGGEMQMIHVLIVENDPMARCLLEMFVSQNEAYGVAASIVCSDLTPDLIREKAVHLALSIWKVCTKRVGSKSSFRM